MRVSSGVSIILLLAATTFSLQAFPMFGEEAEHHTAAAAAAKEQQVERTETAGRRVSDPRGETSDTTFQQRGDNPSIAEEGPAENNPEVSSPSPMPQAVHGASSAEPAASAPAANSRSVRLTRIFHDKSVPTCGRPMPTALDSNFDLDGMKHTATASKPFVRLVSMGLAQRLTTIPHEISGLMKTSKELNAFEVVVQHYNRAESINKRKAVYEQELREEKLKRPSPEGAHRIFGLEHLIPVLEKAIDYQNAMIGKLSEQMKSTNVIGRAPLLLATAIKINESPNKIEKIADHIGRAYERLLFFQTTSTPLERRIDAMPPDQIPESLRQARSFLEQALSDQRRAIAQLHQYAASLRPPFVRVEEQTQALIAGYLLDYKNQKFVAFKNWASAWQKIKSEPSLVRKVSIHHAEIAVNRATQKATPVEKCDRTTRLFNRSAELNQQAARAIEANAEQKAGILSYAAHALFHAAVETQALHPCEQAITWLTCSAALHEQAVAAISENDLFPGSPLTLAGFALSQAAQEAQEPHPNNEVITFYTRSTEFFQQAATAIKADDQDRANDLLNAAQSLFTAAVEAQKPYPCEKALALFNSSADAFGKAAAARLAHDFSTASTFTAAGFNFFDEALNAR